MLTNKQYLEIENESGDVVAVLEVANIEGDVTLSLSHGSDCIQFECGKEAAYEIANMFTRAGNGYLGTGQCVTRAK